MSIIIIMNKKIKKFFKHLRNKDFFRGAAIIFWKVENGKKYVLLSQRSEGYGTGYYSNMGGHWDKADFENDKWVHLNTAIRETAEETKIVKQYHRYESLTLRKQALQKAKNFFLDNPEFKLRKRPIRNFNIYFYHHITYACQATGKMANEKWYNESHESNAGTMEWFALDNLPKKILFACRLNILYVRFCRCK